MIQNKIYAILNINQIKYKYLINKRKIMIYFIVVLNKQIKYQIIVYKNNINILLQDLMNMKYNMIQNKNVYLNIKVNMNIILV